MRLSRRCGGILAHSSSQNCFNHVRGFGGMAEGGRSRRVQTLTGPLPNCSVADSMVVVKRGASAATGRLPRPRTGDGGAGLEPHFSRRLLISPGAPASPDSPNNSDYLDIKKTVPCWAHTGFLNFKRLFTLTHLRDTTIQYRIDTDRIVKIIIKSRPASGGSYGH